MVRTDDISGQNYCWQLDIGFEKLLHRNFYPGGVSPRGWEPLVRSGEASLTVMESTSQPAQLLACTSACWFLHCSLPWFLTCKQQENLPNKVEHYSNKQNIQDNGTKMQTHRI